MEQQYSFGSWLRRNRKALDLTQAELAGNVGCSAAAIRKIEAEERRPSAQIVDLLAEIFNIPQNERTAFLRFARGDWNSAPSAIIEDMPWRISTRASKSNLPSTTTSLIGREKDVSLVCGYLLNPDIRLVTLIGAPGIGKTRLSIAAARAVAPVFPDGVFFVALAPLDNPVLLATAISQALGYVQTKNLSANEQLMHRIGNKQMLIVLDNCEHLVEDVASLAHDLLSSCSQLKVLATSRESLRIAGEWLFSVPALNFPSENVTNDMASAAQFPALTLFTERARAVRSDFALDNNNIATVSAICAHLDGLPLAIELIAARIRWMSPQTLLERLNDQFILSVDGMRAVSVRQKTLTNAIGWSYNLLSTDEQNVFVRLSVFSGGFTLEAAEEILSRTDTQKSVSDLIASLLDKSLLQRTIDARAEPRFTMLATIQQFALQRLREWGEETAARDQHMAYFLNLAEHADREMHGPGQVEWLDRLELEINNFRAAHEWSVAMKNTGEALRLLASLGWFWWMRGYGNEVQSWFDKIRLLPGISDHPVEYARILNQIGRLNTIKSNFREAWSALEESQSVELKAGSESEPGLAETLFWKGVIHWFEADYSTADAFYEQSFELYQKLGDQWGMANAMVQMGRNAAERNDNDRALSMLEQSHAMFRQLGDLWGMARSSQRLGEFFLRLGSIDRAERYFVQYLKIVEKLHFKHGVLIALFNLGELSYYKGDYEKAEQYYMESLAICLEVGNAWMANYNRFKLGLTALHRNDYLLAKRRFTEGFDKDWIVERGVIAAYDFIIGLAAVAAVMNQPERAAKLSGAAQAMLTRTMYRLRPSEQSDLEWYLRIAREQIGETAFDLYIAEGSQMTLEQAVAYAFEGGE